MNKLDEIIPKKYYFKKYGKRERSTFTYWYYHWKAFNVVAKELGCWKFKYLFHDIEKPWLKLFWDYKKVQEWHRTHNKHHSQYNGGFEKIDWEAMVIDNEASRFTKREAQLSAREWYNYCIENDKNAEMMTKYYLPILNKLDI